MIVRVVITGAAGQIGRQIVDELSSSHEIGLIDIRPVPGRAPILANVAKNRAGGRLRRWSWGWIDRHWEAFDGAEIIIHLAEDPHQETSWERVLDNNIQGTRNVLLASAESRVRRVVYASSHRAVKALELELAPACHLADGPKIGSEAQPRPLNPYGIGKAFGEIAGRIFVDEQKLGSFVAVRIGWYQPAPVPRGEDYRRLGIGAPDLRNLFRRCVEADFEGFHVVYGVSAQPIAPFDLRYTRRLLSWGPWELSGQALEQ